MSDFESSDEDIGFMENPTGYLFEPEYTDEELVELEARRAEREQREREAIATGAARPRENATWWCCCTDPDGSNNCQAMPTEVESYCCREWNMAVLNFREMDDPESDEATPASTVCLARHPDFPSVLNRGILRTFFLVPKINWKQKPKAKGPNGQLSHE